MAIAQELGQSMKLENVIDTTENCRYCLMCRHIAPVSVVTHQERYTPHGVALTVASQRRGLIDWTPEMVDVIYSEPDSGNSRAHCVTDQPLPAAIAAVRAQLVEAGLAPPIVYEVHEQLVNHRSAFGQGSQAASGHGSVALFVGDEAFHLRPNTIKAVLKLLDAIGIQPVLIGQGCNSGYLACSLGFPQTATQHAEHILGELEASGAEHLLVLNPGDYFTITQLYPERLGVAVPESIAVTEVMTVLAEAHEAGKLRLKQARKHGLTAYVDPTHAVRNPTRHDAPRGLLWEVLPDPFTELFWRRERALPVGSTALQFTKPDLAAQLTRARLADAQQTGAEVVACEDAVTLHQLEQHADEFGLAVHGLYEALAAHLT